MATPTVQIKNNTDRPSMIWWGHTPYDLPPHGIITVERVIAEAALKNLDYRPYFESGDWEIVGATDVYRKPTAPPSTDSVPPQDPAKGPAPAPPSATPWSGTEWNALVAPINEVHDYVKHHQLKISSDTPEYQIRIIVDEHYLSQD